VHISLFAPHKCEDPKSFNSTDCRFTEWSENIGRAKDYLAANARIINGIISLYFAFISLMFTTIISISVDNIKFNLELITVIIVIVSNFIVPLVSIFVLLIVGFYYEFLRRQSLYIYSFENYFTNQEIENQNNGESEPQRVMSLHNFDYLINVFHIKNCGAQIYFEPKNKYKDILCNGFSCKTIIDPLAHNRARYTAFINPYAVMMFLVWVSFLFFILLPKLILPILNNIYLNINDISNVKLLEVKIGFTINSGVDLFFLASIISFTICAVFVFYKDWKKRRVYKLLAQADPIELSAEHDRLFVKACNSRKIDN